MGQITIKIIKHMGVVLWSIASLTALAASAGELVNGADDNVALGSVVQFSANRGLYAFQFQQNADGTDLMPGCRKLTVQVRYTLAPQALLPFSKTNYPSRKQTQVAINFLKRALRERREIYFGGVGHGLYPTAGSCSFKSNALLLEYRGDKEQVLSYYGKKIE
ncbi:MAG TPA: hypothetical protein VLC91_08030 [Spongiibacteraceae bacterium]|nr:hypothetical protein [Spongiibacteraceae bacterium]